MTDDAGGIAVRARTPDDLDKAVQLALATHHSDAYPRFLPTDLPAFLAPTGELAAWVATATAGRSGQQAIVGHVALHAAVTEPAVADLLTAITGEPGERFALVAR